MSEKKTYGSGSGAVELYVVESRTSYTAPQKHGGMILDGEWRRVFFQKTPVGVPNLEAALHPEAARMGLTNYAAAMALAYWWMALPPDDDRLGVFPSFCVETRVVKVKYSYSFSTDEVGVGPAMSSIGGLRETAWEERA